MVIKYLHPTWSIVSEGFGGKCLSLTSPRVWTDMKKGCRPTSGRKTDWDFMSPKQWGSCFPMNRWLLLFLPWWLDGKRYLLPKCLIKFWLWEAWAIRGKKCHPWDCQGLFPCSPAAASISALKRSPIVPAGQLLFRRCQEGRKEDGSAIVWEIEISFLSAELQAVLILKSSSGLDYLWRGRRRMKRAQSSSEVGGGCTKRM